MISAYAIVTLVLFIISIFFVIHPVSIPTPAKLPRASLNLTTAPILAILILWAAQCITPAVIRDGFVGTEGVKPYNIIILFFSLAYMAITLDISGVLRAAAYWVSRRGGDNGWKLYLYFYVLLTLVSILLGNDPVILSGTAFLVYYTQVAELDPTAWVMAEFAAANTASMVLFVGNPTNVVICEGFSVNNAAFTAYTILPFVACNLFCFVVLAFQFRKQVPRKLKRTTHRDPLKALRDPVAAAVGSFMLGATLILCLVVSFFGIDVWMISLPFAFGKFLFDLSWDYYRIARKIPIGLPEAEEPEEAVADAEHEDDKASRPPTPTDDVERSQTLSSTESRPISTPRDGSTDAFNLHQKADPEFVPVQKDTKINLEKPERSPEQEQPPVQDKQPPVQDKQPPVQDKTVPSLTLDNKTLPIFRWLEQRKHDLYDRYFEVFPTFMTALPRLPFGLVPFAFSQFILIEALNHQGWVNIFGDWLVRASQKQVYPTIWLIGVMGVILCNLSGTNIGATILLTKVVRAAALPNDTNRAAAIALALASNIGAVSFTFSASLAGLLWRSILEQKGVLVKQRSFAFWNMLPIVTMTAVGLGVVSAEMAVLYPS